MDPHALSNAVDTRPPLGVVPRPQMYRNMRDTLRLLALGRYSLEEEQLGGPRVLKIHESTPQKGELYVYPLPVWAPFWGVTACGLGA